MSEQPHTPEPTDQEAADAFYESIYGEPQGTDFTTTDADQDLYTQYFPNN